MTINDVLKIKWIEGEEWFEKWYGIELEFRAFYKGVVPLVPIPNHHLDSLALNTRYYYEEKDADIWEEDKKKIAEKGFYIFRKLIPKTEESINEVKAIIKKVERAKTINIWLLQEIKRGLFLIRNVFLSDLGKSLTPVLQRKLSDKHLSGKQIDKVINYLFQFNHLLGYKKEEKDLMKIYSLFKKTYRNKNVVFENLSKEIKNLLIIHWGKYRYLKGDALDTSEPYTIKDFFKKLKNMEGARTLFIKKKIPQSTRKLLSKEDLKFLDLVHRHIYLDNYAADLWSKLDFLLGQHLSKQFTISLKNLSWYSFTELESLVKNGAKLDKKNLQERKNYRIMVQINGKIKCFYGRKIFQRISSILPSNTKVKNLTQFSGLVASLGIAKGLVKVVRVEKDMKKVNIGDILIATTTRPELMPALRRCSAIVIDTGGITSHAAIISRELRIPCIVGTDIATQVLKDGDFVEVDATRGIVRIIR